MSSRDKKFAIAAFRRAWQDPASTGVSVAKQFGIGHVVAIRLAHSLGLPPKPKGRPSNIVKDPFVEMYLADVRLADMATVFGTSIGSMSKAAKRLGLPPRGKGHRATMTAAAFDQFRHLRDMSRTAAAEQAAMINAEMADGCGSAGMLVGAKHARAA